MTSPPGSRGSALGDIRAKRLFIAIIMVIKRCFMLFTVIMVAPEGFHAAVPSGFAFLGEEAAGDAAFLVAVVRHAFAAFAVSGAGVGAGAGTGVVAVRHNSLLCNAVGGIVSVGHAMIIPVRRAQVNAEGERGKCRKRGVHQKCGLH